MFLIWLNYYFFSTSFKLAACRHFWPIRMHIILQKEKKIKPTLLWLRIIINFMIPHNKMLHRKLYLSHVTHIFARTLTQQRVWIYLYWNVPEMIEQLSKNIHFFGAVYYVSFDLQEREEKKTTQSIIYRQIDR